MSTRASAARSGPTSDFKRAGGRRISRFQQLVIANDLVDAGFPVRWICNLRRVYDAYRQRGPARRLDVRSAHFVAGQGIVDGVTPVLPSSRAICAHFFLAGGFPAPDLMPTPQEEPKLLAVISYRECGAATGDRLRCRQSQGYFP